MGPGAEQGCARQWVSRKDCKRLWCRSMGLFVSTSGLPHLSSILTNGMFFVKEETQIVKRLSLFFLNAVCPISLLLPCAARLSPCHLCWSTHTLELSHFPTVVRQVAGFRLSEIAPIRLLCYHQPLVLGIMSDCEEGQSVKKKGLQTDCKFIISFIAGKIKYFIVPCAHIKWKWARCEYWPIFLFDVFSSVFIERKQSFRVDTATCCSRECRSRALETLTSYDFILSACL